MLFIGVFFDFQGLSFMSVIFFAVLIWITFCTCIGTTSTSNSYYAQPQVGPAYQPTRPESIMLQNLPIMLFGISLIFCLLCLFLCFLDMDYADNSYI